MPIEYELINKITGVTYPVTGVTFGEDNVVATTVELGDVTFSNIGQVGDLKNEDYFIREVGTHLEADGTGTVEVAAEANEGAESVDVPVDTDTETVAVA